MHVSPPTVFDVTAFGATGLGTVDDTQAIKRAYAARRAAKHGVVFFPPGTYVMRPQSYSFSGTLPWEGIVEIDFNYCVSQGVPGLSRIKLQTFGGGNPDTDFRLVWRYGWDAGSPLPGPIPPEAWQGPGHVYSPGAQVTAPNGHTYETFLGGTSGATPPSALGPTDSGPVSDGGVAWYLTDVAWRGSLFRVQSLAIDPALGVTGTVFQDLIFDGGAPRQNSLWPIQPGSNGIPALVTPYDRPGIGFGGATVPAGAGWAIGHSAVVFTPPYNYGNIEFLNCMWTGWRSEGIYSAGLNRMGGITRIDGCTFDDGTADAISVTGQIRCTNTTIRNYSQAIEGDPIVNDQHFSGLTIENCGMGYTQPSNFASYAGRGTTVIQDSTIRNCSGVGVALFGYTSHVIVRRCTIVDCSQTGGLPMLWLLRQFGGTPDDVEVLDNEFRADTYSPLGAFLLDLGEAGAASRIHISGNRMTRTAGAVAAGRKIHSPIGGAIYEPSQVVVEGNDFREADHIEAPFFNPSYQQATWFNNQTS
jgi:hypothetical protein